MRTLPWTGMPMLVAPIAGGAAWCADTLPMLMITPPPACCCITAFAGWAT